jgi:hypothetical protein
MANELTITYSVKYDDGESDPITFSVTDRKRSVTTLRPSTVHQLITTTPLALILGAGTGLGGTVCVRNLDPTNFVTVYNETGGKAIARLDPDTNNDGTGGSCIIERLGADTLAPFAKADTADCLVAIFNCPP